MVCLTGEPGIGKTTLVEEFLTELAASSRPHAITRGRCSERLAGAEAYLPLLEALEGLLRGETGDGAARAMQAMAPSWYAQVAPAADGAGAPAPAASQERMKRELLAFLERMCRVRPLAIFLDDVHWGDASTVDLLAYVGSRSASLRLLLVLTYRPTEILMGPHPFLAVQLDLQRRGLCREVALEFLTRADVDGYLAIAFPGNRFPAEFAQVLHAKTEGSPLFLVDLLRYLRDRGVVAKGSGGGWKLAQDVPDFGRELPESVRSLIRTKMAQLREPDQQLLSVASVQGHEFDSAVVARVLGAGAAEVEERLKALEQIHGLVRLRREQELPDGTLSLRYHFVHVLYQNCLYAALQPARRTAVSAAVAAALLAYHGDKSGAVAGELALLLEAARDWPLAVDYFGLAAENAARVYANQEAIVLARRGLDLIPKVPESSRRAQQELRLLMALTIPLQTIQGYAAPDVGEVCSRARALCEQLGESAAGYSVLWRLALFEMVRGELGPAQSLAEQCLRLAHTVGDPSLLTAAHMILGTIAVYRGQLAVVLEHMSQVESLYDPVRDAAHTVLYGNHPVVIAHSFASWALWLLGYPDRAVTAMERGLKLAQALGHPQTLANAWYFAASLHRYRREPRQTREMSQSLMQLANEQGLILYHALGMIWHGWALTQEGQLSEGMQQIYRGASAFRATGARAQQTQFVSMIAQTQVMRGQVSEGLTTLAEALSVVTRGGEAYEDAELHRLRGEFLLQKPVPEPAEAESCFRQALARAQQQQTKSFELRAAVSLARLLQAQGRPAEGRKLLAETYGWFTEGWETPDLREAKDLLGSLG
jgi:adenylate cyclase